jgi:hypothetical protein
MLNYVQMEINLAYFHSAASSSHEEGPGYNKHEAAHTE